MRTETYNEGLAPAGPRLLETECDDTWFPEANEEGEASPEEATAS